VGWNLLSERAARLADPAYAAAVASAIADVPPLTGEQERELSLLLAPEPAGDFQVITTPSGVK
jgi:hypothetical protein